MKTWKFIAETLVKNQHLITEAKEIEYYIEDKLLSVVMSTQGEASEVTFFVAGGSDEGGGASVDEKQRGTRLLVKILKLLQNKGYFGDVAQFLSGSAVKRQLINYGIVHVPLSTPMAHKELRRILHSAGLEVVSATQYDKAQEKTLDKKANPKELEKYHQSLEQPDEDEQEEEEPKQPDYDDDEDEDKDDDMKKPSGSNGPPKQNKPKPPKPPQKPAEKTEEAMNMFERVWSRRNNIMMQTAEKQEQAIDDVYEMIEQSSVKVENILAKATNPVNMDDELKEISKKLDDAMAVIEKISGRQ